MEYFFTLFGKDRLQRLPHGGLQQKEHPKSHCETLGVPFVDYSFTHTSKCYGNYRIIHHIYDKQNNRPLGGEYKLSYHYSRL